MTVPAPAEVDARDSASAPARLLAATTATAATRAAGLLRRRLSRPATTALALGAAGVGYRLWLLLHHTPVTNSDEATMSLAALHIAQGRQLPVFFPGQYYMGAIESYLAAPLFAVFEPTQFTMRLPVLAGYAVFLWLVYQLTSRVYAPWLAVLTVGVLALGADRVVKDQLITGGGYPELLPLGTAALLLAVALGSGAVRRRGLGFAGWGLLAGLLIWDDWLIAPYLLAATVILVAGCRRELRGRNLLLLVGGLLLGAAPSIAANATATWSHNSWTTFLNLNSGAQAPFAQRLQGGLGTGVSLATGLCQPSHCGPVQHAWSYGYVALLLVAASLAALALRAPRPAAAASPTPTALPFLAAGRAPAAPGGAAVSEPLRSLSQLGLALAALVTIALYVRSPAAAHSPIESARYLSCLQISTAAGLWPLWLLLRRVLPAPGARPRWRQAVPGLATGVAVAGLVVVMLSATAAVTRLVPANTASDARIAGLDRELRALGITRVYSEYWTCHRLVFATQERIICAALERGLRRGDNRFPGYVDELGSQPSPAYVTPTLNDPWLADELAAYLSAEHIAATVTVIPGYRIYQVTGRIGLPRTP